MLNRTPLWVTAVAAVAVGLTACAGGSGKTATAPSSSTPNASASSTPKTPHTTGSPVRLRKVVELKAALLALTDLPSGYAIEPASTGDEGDGSASSKDQACAPLVKLINGKTAPGSTSSASVAFSGGQDGPFVDESIDALGSADAVKGLQVSFESAVAACQKLTITIPGQGSSTMNVAEVSAPKFGDHTFAARMTATGGPLEGLEITQVTAGVKDVVVSLTFLASFPEDIDSGTESAVGKAEVVLGRATAGA